MNLELKHLAAYAAHELKMKIDFPNGSQIGKMLSVGLHPGTGNESLLTVFVELSPTDRRQIIYKKDASVKSICKPLLLPLSALNDEIYYNGKLITPFVEIAKIEAPNIVAAQDRIKDIKPFVRGLSFNSSQQGVSYRYEDVIVEITRFKDCIFHKKVMSGNNTWIFSYFHNYPAIMDLLYKYHFDVHNLIPAGLALDKRDYEGKEGVE